MRSNTYKIGLAVIALLYVTVWYMHTIDPIQEEAIVVHSDTLFFTLQVATGIKSIHYGAWQVQVYPAGSGRVVLGNLEEMAIYLPAGSIDFQSFSKSFAPFSSSNGCKASASLSCYTESSTYTPLQRPIDPQQASRWIHQMVITALENEPSMRRRRQVLQMLRQYPPGVG